MAFESSGKTISGVLIEEDALYEAWHVRCHIRPDGLPHPISERSVMVFTNALLPPAHPVTRMRVTAWNWDCPHCQSVNVEHGKSVQSQQILVCSNCTKKSEGVLVDIDDDILREGSPFPED